MTAHKRHEETAEKRSTAAEVYLKRYGNVWDSGDSAVWWVDAPWTGKKPHTGPWWMDVQWALWEGDRGY